MNPPSKDETTTPHVSSSHSRAAPRPERYHVPGIVLPTVQTRATTKRYSPDRIVDTLRELGTGFAFVGRQVHFDVAGDDFYLDLLFFHIEQLRYVVIELKTGKFQP